jgi:hypothetical protein
MNNVFIDVMMTSHGNKLRVNVFSVPRPPPRPPASSIFRPASRWASRRAYRRNLG